METLTENLLN